MVITTTTNDIKERLSIAYVTAIAARAGCQASRLDIDKQSVDLTLRPISGKKISIDLQLKATSSDCIVDDKVVFSLPIKNYDDLRDTNSTAPHYLVVLVLDGDELEWLASDEHGLLMKKSAYWLSLRGAGPSMNKESITVHIPRIQHFGVSALHAMMHAAYQPPAVDPNGVFG